MPSNAVFVLIIYHEDIFLINLLNLVKNRTGYPLTWIIFWSLLELDLD